MRRFLMPGLALLAAASLVLPATLSLTARGKEKTYKMVTVVEGFATTSWTLQCVPRGKIDVGAVPFNEVGMVAMIDCLRDIESEKGVRITSRTVVRDAVVESDKVVGVTELTAADVEKLKGIIEDPENLVPSPALFRSRARIQSVLCDGAITEMYIDFGDGRLINVFDPVFSEQQMNQLLQIAAEAELVLGVDISNVTVVRDGAVEKDRTVAVTFLDGDALAELGQFLFEGLGIGVPPGIYVIPFGLDCVAKIQTQQGRQKHKLALVGEGYLFDQRAAGPSAKPGEPIPVVLSDVTAAQDPIGGPPASALFDFGFPAEWEVLAGKRPKVRVTSDDPGLILTIGAADYIVAFPRAVSGAQRLPLRKTLTMKMRGKALLLDPLTREPVGTLKIKRITLGADPRPLIFFD